MRNVPEAQRRPHVILAEDNADLRATLADVLDEMGTKVEAVADGGRFLACIASHYDEGRSPAQVDLIVTDVTMPVCSGFEILDAIRAAGWKTPAIVMTGFQTPAIYARATRLGATLLIKPLDLYTFEGTVVELLARGSQTTLRRPSRIFGVAKPSAH